MAIISDFFNQAAVSVWDYFLSSSHIWPIPRKASSSDHVNKAADILGEADPSAEVTMLFETFVKKMGISEDNYLSWDDRYISRKGGQIDGIMISDISYPVMWGIDPKDRLFIVIKCKHKTAIEGPEIYKSGVQNNFSKIVCKTFTIYQQYSMNSKKVGLAGSIGLYYKEFSHFRDCIFPRLIDGDNIVIDTTETLDVVEHSLKDRVRKKESLSLLSKEEARLSVSKAFKVIR